MGDEARLGLLFTAWIVVGGIPVIIATSTPSSSPLHRKCISMLAPWSLGFVGLLALWTLEAGLWAALAWSALCVAAALGWLAWRRERARLTEGDGPS